MKINKFKVFFVVFAIFTIIFTIVKLSTKNKAKVNNESNVAKETVYQDNLRLGISNYDTINPLLTRNKQLLDIEQLVFEPLLKLDSNYNVKSCLATEYAKTSATTYIVKINNSRKWSNRSLLDANDVKFTVDLLKSCDNIYSENIKNISNVEVLDNCTVKFNLNEEVGFFEYNLIFPIMCKSYYDNEDFFTSKKYSIGTGSYKISEVTSNQIILEKNENYREQDKTNRNITKIYINIYSEIGEVYNSFKIGNIDIVNTSSLSYEDYVGKMGYYVKEYKGRECDFLSCNCNDYLMKDKAVRQAVSYAIDKDNIVSNIYNNKYVPSQYVLDYGVYLYPSNMPNIGCNIEKAKEILTSGGWVYSNNRWRKNGGTLNFTISVNSSNIKRCETAKIIKAQLESIGIPVNVKEVSDSQYKYYLENKNYQLLLTGVYNSYSPDVTYFYGDNNIANYNNETVKEIIKETKNISDIKKLEESYKTLINITKDECPYICIYRNKNYMLINQNVVGNFNPTCYGIFNNFETWNRE